MDLKEAIRDIAKRSRVARDTAETEEATKNAVIMPFIRALGFDVFDLNQVDLPPKNRAIQKESLFS